MTRGKLATAFLEAPAYGAASTVCVNDAGLFVTNRHVVQNLGDADKVKLGDARTTMGIAVLRATGPAAPSPSSAAARKA